MGSACCDALDSVLRPRSTIILFQFWKKIKSVLLMGGGLKHHVGDGGLMGLAMLCEQHYLSILAQFPPFSLSL